MKRKVYKSKPQSRVRYEQAHPTISVRVSRHLYDRLDEIRTREGKSFGDILREAVGVQERDTSNAYNRGFREGRKKGEEDGYTRGRAEGETAARNRYLVKYQCSTCGGWIELSTRKRKQRDSAWSRAGCTIHAPSDQAPRGILHGQIPPGRSDPEGFA